jgi:O-antigen/teichoic acid export membrane protein
VSFAGRVRQGLLWNQLGRLAEMGLTYAASVVAARAFGPLGFATWSVALSFVTLGTLTTSLGLNELLNLEVPRLAALPGRIVHLLTRVARVRIVTALALGATLFLAAPAIARAWANPALLAVVRAAAAYALFYPVSQLLEYFLVGRLEVGKVARVRVLVQGLHLGAAAIVLALHAPPPALFLAMAANAALGVAILAASARGSVAGGYEAFDLAPARRTALALWATGLVSFLVGRQADILLIGLFRPGTPEAGAYSIASTLAMLLAGALLMGAEGVSLAAFSELEARVDRGGLGRLWAFHVKVDVLLSVPLLAFGAVFADEIVSVLYGPGFDRAAVLLGAYAGVWIVARPLGGGTNLAVLYAMKSPRLPLVIAAACGLWNLVLDLLLIPRIGAHGAVIATGSAMIASGLASGIVVWRRTGVPFPFAFSLQIIALAAVAAFAALLVPHPRGLAGLVVAGVVALVVCLFGLRLLRPFGPDDRRLLARLAPRLERVVAAFVGAAGDAKE